MHARSGMRWHGCEDREMTAAACVIASVARHRKPARDGMLEAEQASTAENRVSECSEESHVDQLV